MGLLDNVLASAVPQGNASKPLKIALGALLASGTLFKTASAGTKTSSPPAPPSHEEGGDLLGGLGGLVKQFEQGGLGDVAKSWIGSGQNQPISSNQLSSVLGPKIIEVLAQKTGLSGQELAGFIGSKIVNKQGEGLFLDIALGVVGAIVGGAIFSFFGAEGITGLNIYSMIVAVVGSVVVLWAYHAFLRR